MIKKSVFFCCILSVLLAWSCTFDYGENEDSGDDMPNLVMKNVEYVRVRSADPLARIQAERIERYEKQNLIKLENLSFEQFGEKGEEVNVYGKVGFASVEIESGDILMDRGVTLDVAAEDLTLEAYQLEWKDEPRSLSTRENDEVYIYRENGTRFTGTGLRVDARSREWEFSGRVSGTYIHDDDDEDK